MNMLVKGVKGREYIITDMIATRLTKKHFERLQAQNEILADFRFKPANQVDFSWWSRCYKKLTPKKLYDNVCFEIDFYGKVTEV